MSPAKRTTKSHRQRRTPAAARKAILAAARELLMRSGPQTITLQAIARRLGMTHGNITHHFGSVSALHACLVDQLARELTSEVTRAVIQLRTTGADPGKVVDALFDAFARSEAGRLVCWLAATGNLEALQPLFATVSRTVHELTQTVPPPREARQLALRRNALELIPMALGNAIIGQQLHAALDLPPDELRKLAAAELTRRP